MDAADLATSATSTDGPPRDAILSWLVRGIHPFAIDPRRLGGRGHARRVLGQDGRLAPDATGGWRELVSALQRHTLHNALIHLSAEERQVVTLAYLQGRTNRQIAALLGVSVSTVRRRLWLALEHLDEYVRRTGRWISLILLLSLAHASGWTTRISRFANIAGSVDWPHKLAATVAVGTVAVAGVGLAAANHNSSTPRHSAPSAASRLIPDLLSAPTSSLAIAVPGNPTSSVPPSETRTATTETRVESDTMDKQSGQGEVTSQVNSETSDKQSDQGEGASQNAAGKNPSNRACHGKPIKAVSSTSDHPEGSVKHLTSDGCEH